MLDPITLTSIALGSVSAIAATISAFKDGKSLFQKWREKRKAQKEKNVENSHDLDSALVKSPNDIRHEYDRLCRVGGPRFTAGDHDFVDSVKESIERFHRSLIQTIRVALSQATNATTLNLNQLLGATASLHRETKSNMADLFQRVELTKPIPRSLPRDPETQRSISTFLPPLPLALLPPPTQPYESSSDNALSLLQDELDSIATTPLEDRYTAEGLRRRLTTLRTSSSASPTPRLDSPLHTLPSESLVQAQLRALAQAG